MLRFESEIRAAGRDALSEDELKTIFRAGRAQLELEVGLRLAMLMTPGQIAEFEATFNRDDDEGAERLLVENFPNYQQIVHHEFDALLERVEALADVLTSKEST